ncbi:MAG: SRPBCC family protein [Betaproteobacteria bacterium]|nr:SRPBCC family protein [Betaproteobacteria bacterium]
MQKSLYASGAFVAVLILIGFLLPRHSRVEVSALVDAPAATVFALVNDFRRVELWASRTATDPNARVIFSGPPRGVGATVTWDGVVAGSGTQTIVESRPYEHLATTINPGEAGEAHTWFDIGREDGATRVTWGFAHDHGFNLVGRYLALLLTGVVRREFETGIAALEELAESLPPADFGDLEVEHLIASALDIAYLPTTSPPEPAAISDAMGKAYFEILTFIDAHGLAENGAPMSIVRGFAGSELRFDAAIPVRGVTPATPRGSAAVRLGLTYSGPAIRVRHRGSYRQLGTTHRKIAAYLAAVGLERNGDPWETYIGDPTRVTEAELLTDIYCPVRED